MTAQRVVIETTDLVMVRKIIDLLLGEEHLTTDTETCFSIADVEEVGDIPWRA